jgi:hypothetical protein
VHKSSQSVEGNHWVAAGIANISMRDLGDNLPSSFLPRQQRIYTLSHSKHTSWNLLEYCFVLSALSVNAEDVNRKINNDKEKRNCQTFCAFIQSSIALKWFNLLNKIDIMNCLYYLLTRTQTANANSNDLFHFFNHQK